MKKRTYNISEKQINTYMAKYQAERERVLARQQKKMTKVDLHKVEKSFNEIELAEEIKYIRKFSTSTAPAWYQLAHRFDMLSDAQVERANISAVMDICNDLGIDDQNIMSLDGVDLKVALANIYSQINDMGEGNRISPEVYGS